MTNFTIKLVISILLSSCSVKNSDQKVLYVDITKEKELTASELFNKIEIIPLETTDKSLITAIGRIIEYDDRYYILDDRIAVLFCFDKQGKFIYKIDKNGNGPDEYSLIYETIIKPENNLI